MDRDVGSGTVRNTALVGVRRIAVRDSIIEIEYATKAEPFVMSADVSGERSRFVDLMFSGVHLMRHKRYGRFAIAFGEPDNETLGEYEELARGHREC